MAIETSCDETACAVVEDGTKILSSVVASSTDMHKKYGGIVPEIAAREQLKCIIPVIEEVLKVYSSSEESSTNREGDKGSSLPIKSGSNNIKNVIDKHIDAIAVTVGPGLIGSLLVGVETAKTIAFITGKPIITVNHVLAHMYANFVDVIPSEVKESLANASSNKLRDSSASPQNDSVTFPAISLVVSGGHTELYLMKSMKDLTWLGGTLDDAAGECFDKSARLLGFGNGGGMAIEKAASQLKIKTLNFKLPRPMLKDESLSFSFSGLKTAILREVNKLKQTEQFNNPPTGEAGSTIQQLAYEIQEAITDVLVEKTLRAAEKYNVKSILLSGGVAANSRLREKFISKLRSYEATKLSFSVPPPSLCTDNAVYIGSYAFFQGKPIDWHEVTAVPDLSVEK